MVSGSSCTGGGDGSCATGEAVRRAPFTRGAGCDRVHDGVCTGTGCSAMIGCRWKGCDVRSDERWPR
eukprot:1087434-Prymnesium_polylepis.2